MERLTFLNHRRFGGRGRVALFDVAGEVGLSGGQVLEQQAADVAREEADLGAFLEGGVLLFAGEGGVEEPLALRELAEGLRRLCRERVLAVHPEVVLGQ